MLRKKLTMLTAALLTALSVINTPIFADKTQYTGDPNAPFGRYSVGDLIKSNDFDNGESIGWQCRTTFPASAKMAVEDGKCNVTIDQSYNERWGVQLSHRGLTLEKGHKYNVQFEVTANKDCKVYAKVGDVDDPYYEYWNNNWEPFIIKEGQTVKVNQTFVMNRDAEDCELAFHLAGDCGAYVAPWTVSFDNVHIYDDQFPGYKIERAQLYNAIKVNQLGYYAGTKKTAVVDSISNDPIEWRLVDDSKKVLKTGVTTVKGKDSASGENVHLIDFSDFTSEGHFKLEVDKENVDSSYHYNDSIEFSITNSDLYKDLTYTSLKYFYNNRSAMEIQSQYSPVPREAIGLNEILRPDSYSWYSKETEDDKAKDIRGGWLQNTDYEKYVDEGAFATWMLQNKYEFAKNTANSFNNNNNLSYSDNVMKIPESGDGMPDMLNEARFSLESLLNMQISEENKYAGMVFNNTKVNKNSLLPYPVVPEDYKTLYLQPPTTSATLELAAVAAQGSRLWKDYDDHFSEKCLKAAENAWNAAIKYPDIFNEIGTNKELSDEFYLAACELYSTTGKEEYLDYIKSSSHYLQVPTTIVDESNNEISGTFDKQNVQALGTLSLISSKVLDDEDLKTVSKNIKDTADKLLETMDENGYGVPLKESVLKNEKSGYPMNSNLYVSNAAVVLSYASDLYEEYQPCCGVTSEQLNDFKYITGATKCLDYLLGKNPNNISYITGFGENQVEHPNNIIGGIVPYGYLVSGPNSEMIDSVSQSYGFDSNNIPAQKCYIDNDESWSTNRVGLSTNASLAWLTTYLSDNTDKLMLHEDNHNLVLLGDVNGDQRINIKDYLLIQNYLMNPSVESIVKENSDLNKDGKINVVDLILIKKILMS